MTIMNLKDRGITIGDLLIFVIIITISIFIIKKVNGNMQANYSMILEDSIEIKRNSLFRKWKLLSFA